MWIELELTNYCWSAFRKSVTRIFICAGLALVVVEPFGYRNRVLAQNVPDATLGAERSVVTPRSDSVEVISGGATRGTSLFHSFKQFSVLSGHTAFFENSLGIQNIITRVTGGSVSNINGLIKANGTANLFLLNPSGIFFGPNASLNIGGSFLATTASSLKFPDGNYFSANVPESTPLLTISVPVGLQFGQNPAEIHVQGIGHSLTIPAPYFSPILGAGNSLNGLRVHSGKTLALVGGNVTLDGGILTAPRGRIELGSVASGVVSLNPTSSGWSLGYDGVSNFKDTLLSQRALVDVSGSGGGFIRLVGRQISLANASVALSQNQGAQAGGSIDVRALDSLTLTGASPDGKLPSGLQNETIGGHTDNITISAKHLIVQDGAAINTKTFTGANGGNIILNDSDSTEIKGYSPVSPTVDFASGVGAYTFSSGHGGGITITTGQFMALNGGVVIAGTFGTGGGGDLIVNAARSVQLIGFNPFVGLAPSQLAVGTFNTGDTGHLIINAPKILLQDGGNVNSYTFASGNAGPIVINASNSVEITRVSKKEPFYNSAFGISSYAAVTSDILQKLLRIPPGLSGESGSITINTGRLSATSNVIISVTNLGTGNAGDIKINANTIFIDQNAAISSASTSGRGGNISLQAHQVQLRHKSTIDANASESVLLLPSIDINPDCPVGVCNGGNITIKTGTLVASENSPITANANQGRGGNIRITAQGIFRSPDSQISASSQLGINGTVQINTLEQDAVRDPGILPVVPVDLTKLIAPACAANVGPHANSFIITGSGGLPPNPSAPQHPDRAWADLGSNPPSTKVSSAQFSNKSTPAIVPSTEIEYYGGPLVEAQAMVRGKDGDVILTADAPTLTPDIPWLKPSSCQMH